MQRTSEIFHDDFYDFHADLNGNDDNDDENGDDKKVFWCKPSAHKLHSFTIMMIIATPSW